MRVLSGFSILLIVYFPGTVLSYILFINSKNRNSCVMREGWVKSCRFLGSKVIVVFLFFQERNFQASPKPNSSLGLLCVMLEFFNFLVPSFIESSVLFLINK